MIKHLTQTIAVFAALAAPLALHTAPSSADATADWEWIAEKKPDSLLTNGGFEITTSKGSPVGWNTWTRHGTGKFESVVGLENQGKAVQISAPKPEKGEESSVLSQNVSAQAGKKYVGVVWVRADNKEDASAAGISLRLRDDKGWWKGEPSVFRGTSAVASDEWQKLLVSATIPEGVTGVGLLLGASNGKAVYDNAALYEVP